MMLDSKKVIATGTASGIGRATAVFAAREGVDVAVAAFGTIDDIVCSAIRLQPSTLKELTEDAWDAVIEVSLKGYILRPSRRLSEIRSTH